MSWSKRDEALLEIGRLRAQLEFVQWEAHKQAEQLRAQINELLRAVDADELERLVMEETDPAAWDQAVANGNPEKEPELPPPAAKPKAKRKRPRPTPTAIPSARPMIVEPVTAPPPNQPLISNGMAIMGGATPPPPPVVRSD